MSTLQDMETFVLNDPAVAAMIKSFTPITLPQHPVYPAATYFQVDRAHEHTMEGLETVHPRIQIDCYGHW